MITESGCNDCIGEYLIICVLFVNMFVIKSAKQMCNDELEIS